MSENAKPDWSLLDKLPKAERIDCALLNAEGARISRGYFFAVSDPDRYHYHATDNSSDELVQGAKKLKAYPEGAFGKSIIYKIAAVEMCQGNLSLHWHMTLVEE